MEQSPLRLIKRCAEYIPIDDIDALPRGLRGIYVLYFQKGKNKKFDVVYVGMTNAFKGGGIRGRLQGHRDEKSGLWTHSSVYEVWNNIRDEEVKELEGLFRHIYKSDSKASPLNTQRTFAKIDEIVDPNFADWRNN